MSDDGNSFYFAHANGQTWFELGQEGTFDVYSTNSVNIRTAGTLNFHADKDINMYAGGSLSLMSKKTSTLQSEEKLVVATKGGLTLYSAGKIGVRSDGTIALMGVGGGSWNGGGAMSLSGSRIDLNGGKTISVEMPEGLTAVTSPDTTFNNSGGWKVQADSVKSICTRVPAHEPWPFHNQGVGEAVSLEPGQPSVPPDAPPMPTGWSATAK